MVGEINSKHLEVLVMLERINKPLIDLDFVRNNLLTEALELVELGLILKDERQAEWKIQGDTESFYELNPSGRNYLARVVKYAFEIL